MGSHGHVVSCGNRCSPMPTQLLCLEMRALCIPPLSEQRSFVEHNGLFFLFFVHLRVVNIETLLPQWTLSSELTGLVNITYHWKDKHFLEFSKFVTACTLTFANLVHSTSILSCMFDRIWKLCNQHLAVHRSVKASKHRSRQSKVNSAAPSEPLDTCSIPSMVTFAKCRAVQGSPIATCRGHLAIITW